MASHTQRVLSAAVAAMGLLSMARSAQSAIVINEVYQGGGNNGASFNADFFELYNNGLAPVDLSNYTLQYGAASGLYASNTFITFTLPGGASILPGGYYLIGGAGNTATTNTYPAFDYDALSGINAATAAGKIRLLDSSGTVLDVVGWGTSVTDATGTGTGVGFTGAGFETSPAPTPGSNAASITRTLGLDTNNNANDFTVSAAPTPTAGAVPEPATLGLAAAAGALFVGRRKR